MCENSRLWNISRRAQRTGMALIPYASTAGWCGTVRGPNHFYCVYLAPWFSYSGRELFQWPLALLDGGSVDVAIQTMDSMSSLTSLVDAFPRGGQRCAKKWSGRCFAKVGVGRTDSHSSPSCPPRVLYSSIPPSPHVPYQNQDGT